MFLSLGCALVVYLPILFLLATVGVEPGGSITELAEREGDTVFATAVSQYMGTAGYWLVIVAAVLATLSALHATMDKLEAAQGELPLILPSVDRNAVATVVQDWTGIPTGRMLASQT